MKSHSVLNLLLSILTIFLIMSCDKDENPTGPNVNNGFIYPLKVGNQWEYKRTFSTFNIRPDTLKNKQFADTTTSSIIIKIIKKETLFDSVDTFVFQEILNETFIDYSYYANLDSGLYFYAYRGPGLVIPKTSRNNKILFNGRYFNNIREITSYITKAIPQDYILMDSLIYEIPSLQSLKYPIKIGSQWTYRYPGKPWRIDKKILNYEKVKVTAGSFNCFKIQWLYDINHDGIWDNDIIFYDYVCEKGLIKRSIIFKDLIITGEQSTEPIGLMDCKDESVLTKLTL